VRKPETLNLIRTNNQMTILESDGCKIETKSKAGTVHTCAESSEEFTLSAELSTGCGSIGTTAEMAAMSGGQGHHRLQLSGLAIVESNEAQERQKQRRQQKGKLAPTAEGKGVHFLEDVTYITNENSRSLHPTQTRKKKTWKEQERDDEKKQAENDRPISDDDIWWNAKELKEFEDNAMYIVKESQQYQEEVICTVLYNKAFLTASELARTTAEEELEDKLKDIGFAAQNLESWTAVGQSRRGLESLVSDKAQENAIESRKTALQFQNKLRATASNDDGGNTAAATLQHETFLARKCQELSRTARIFARMMGQADHDSLERANLALQDFCQLPEPPGLYDNYDYDGANGGYGNEGVSKTNRRGSRLLQPIKKGLASVFRRRQSSEDGHRKRILRMQRKQMKQNAAENESQRRPSQEFRRSFLEKLGYGVE